MLVPSATFTPSSRRRGFTLVELLVTIALIGLTSLPFFTAILRSRNQQSLVSATEQFADQLRTAHIFSREQRNNQKWGIMIENAHEYSLTSQNHGGELTEAQSFPLPTGLTFLTGPTAIWFDSGTGNRATPVTITLTNPDMRLSQIHIYETGLVEVEIVK